MSYDDDHPYFDQNISITVLVCYQESVMWFCFVTVIMTCDSPLEQLKNGVKCSANNTSVPNWRERLMC